MEFVVRLLFWGIMCALCALVGKNRPIGYVWTLILCMCLSPIIGVVIALFSKKNDTDFTEIK